MDGDGMADVYLLGAGGRRLVRYGDTAGLKKSH